MSDRIFSIAKPHPNLLKHYFIQAMMTGPGFLISFPLLFCRYYTLQYQFDSESIRVSWGLLFRKEVSLTYARIQDIQLSAGIVQRWLGLADIQIQTASGASEAEIIIEGILEYEALRDFLYHKMRGKRDGTATITGETVVPRLAEDEYDISYDDDRLELLQEILSELKKSRKLLETVAAEK